MLNIASREQPAILTSLDYPFDSNSQSSQTMRDFFLFSSFDHSAKGLLQDPKKAIGNLRLVPEEALETLHPFKVGNNHSACIAEDVGNYKDLAPTFEQYLIAVDCGWSICALRQNPAPNFPGVPSTNYSTDSCRYQDVARQGQEIVGRDRLSAREPCQVSVVQSIFFGG